MKSSETIYENFASVKEFFIKDNNSKNKKDLTNMKFIEKDLSLFCSTCEYKLHLDVCYCERNHDHE
jgi:hypothetical protein